MCFFTFSQVNLQLKSGMKEKKFPLIQLLKARLIFHTACTMNLKPRQDFWW